MNIPSPQQMANAIAISSLSTEEKEAILKKLKYLPEWGLLKLYEALKFLEKKEHEYLKQIDRIDLKYKIKLEEEIRKAKS